MNRADAKVKINNYITRLKKNNVAMTTDFAEALATYMVLNGITKPNQARMKVWLMGENGLTILRGNVEALPQ